MIRLIILTLTSKVEYGLNANEGFAVNDITLWMKAGLTRGQTPDENFVFKFDRKDIERVSPLGTMTQEDAQLLRILNHAKE